MQRSVIRGMFLFWSTYFICSTEKVKLDIASNMGCIAKARRAGSTYAPGVMSRVMQGTIRRLCQNGSGSPGPCHKENLFMFFSGLVLWRRHVAAAMSPRNWVRQNLKVMYGFHRWNIESMDGITNDSGVYWKRNNWGRKKWKSVL